MFVSELVSKYNIYLVNASKFNKKDAWVLQDYILPAYI